MVNGTHWPGSEISALIGPALRYLAKQGNRRLRIDVDLAALQSVERRLLGGEVDDRQAYRDTGWPLRQ